MKAKTYYVSMVLLGILCFWSLRAEFNIIEPAAPQRKVSQTYKEYHPESLLASKTDFNLLYFHASWCPSCRRFEENMLDNLHLVPSDLSIFKVDFDQEKELKSRYEVKLQTTVVLVDKDGQLVKKWLGVNSLEKILKDIHKQELI